MKYNVLLIVTFFGFNTFADVKSFSNAQIYKNSYDARMESLRKNSWSSKFPSGYNSSASIPYNDSDYYTPKQDGMRISDIEAWIAAHPEEHKQFKRYMAFKNKDHRRMFDYMTSDAWENPSLWPAIANLYFNKYEGIGYMAPEVYEAEGVSCYERASNKGIHSATVDLAFFYLDGKHVAKNETKGVELLTKAADAGYAQAQGQLAMVYHAPIYSEIKTNPELALKYAKLGADQKDPQSLYVLGNIHLLGVGVKADKKQAKEFFKLSADAGNETAKNMLKKIK